MSFATKASIFIGAAAFSGMAVAGTGATSNDLQSRLEAAEAHIAELSAQQDGDWLTEQRSEQVRGIVQDVLADADTRASLQGSGATSGYDNGFFVQSADGKWSMKINGLFQERFNVGHQPGAWNGATNDQKETAFGFETTRAALNFSGELAGVAYYNARLDWSPYNTGGGNGLSASELEWAYGGWHVNDNWSVQMGRQKMNVMRGFMVNAEDQQAIERSSYNYYWASSQITNGVMVKGAWDSFRMNGMFSNGATNNGANVGNNTWGQNGNSWAVTGRAEWLLQGDWAQFDHIGSRPQTSRTRLTAGTFTVPVRTNAPIVTLSMLMTSTRLASKLVLVCTCLMTTSFMLVGSGSTLASVQVNSVRPSTWPPLVGTTTLLVQTPRSVLTGAGTSAIRLL
jgi:hypothetical protein